ncbi:MAG: ParB/RepB/Spo0J family partition protein [Candidatus Latescibacteria bacterium]|nr:ParB/RepB/Spo0J family partition protein [Candidatus Latescibacterota bacterium]
MAKKPALGKGINALIPEYPETSAASDGNRQIVNLNVDDIEANPYQARTEFSPEQLDELSRSIKEKGVIQPISVNRIGQNYQLIAGERRWRASKLAGYDTIPAVVYEIESQQELMELSLIENIQREDLNAIEEAEGYHALLHTCFLTHEQVAQKVGKKRTTVTNLVRLLELPQEIQGYLKKRELQAGHARALLGLDNEEVQLELAKRCIDNKMTAREVERAVNAIRSGRDRPRRARSSEATDPHIVSFQEKLQHRYGTAVNIRRNEKKGRVEIEFYGDGDLERILELLLDEQRD